MNLRSTFTNNAALKVSCIYAGFSVLWILFSDQILLFFIKDAAELTTVQILKGWLFVIVTGVIIFFLLKKEIVKSKRTENILWATLHSTADGILVISNEGRVIASNSRFAAMWSILHEMDVDSAFPRGLIKHVVEQVEDPEGYFKRIDSLSRSSTDALDEIRLKDGRIFECFTTPLIQDGTKKGRVWCFHDLTERKHAQEEQTKLEGQLQQAQKMESIGRLAGGVAHDYNNMLSVIIGYAELSLEKAGSNEPLQADIMEILTAAKRSAEITRQLLAFARKQTIMPKVLDLNGTVESLLNMLRRLIGEDIDLAWLPGEDIWPVKMDPAQIDQILANLCINARDAIAGVGRITIETANMTFDEDYCAAHSGFIPGEYVLLSISDDGCGMDKETLDHMFEPFFTTKDVGQGTGLGMATVYGIIRQNNGFINVYSEPDKGTTISICITRHLGPGIDTDFGQIPDAPLGCGETILIVEDETAILELTGKILKGLGYTVLSANSPGKALRLARQYADEIHLLVTDVVMPEMNGRDLAEQLLSLYPKMKALFMSGYTANTIAHRGVLDEGISFIQKPFAKKELAIKIRSALDQG